MLYLHCGWPRTGTTSLQVALARQRARLAAGGLIYPDRWNPKGLPAHHGLTDLLQASLQSDGEFEDLTRFLTAHAKTDLLLSAESLTNWLLTREKQAALLKLLGAAREVMPTRCVWTLRRLDDVARSLYLLRVGRGVRSLPPEGHFADLPHPGLIFEGMCRVEQEVGGNAIYVKYDASGGHNRELLKAFRVPEDVGAEIQAELAKSPRANVGLTRKQAIALLRLDALSLRAEADLDANVLRAAFAHGESQFDADQRCVTIDGEGERRLRERAVAAACLNGFTPYVEFFADAEAESVADASLDIDAFTDKDLNYLRHL